jgi:hypothetical protein
MKFACFLVLRASIKEFLPHKIRRIYKDFLDYQFLKCLAWLSL